jgi:hypothetical protein
MSDAEDHLEALTQRRRFRRPDHHAIDDTQHQISAQQRYLERLEKERARSAAELERSRRRLGDTERAVARVPDVEAAIERRSDWLVSHPAELDWEADLAARLAGNPRTADQPVLDHDQTAIDHALEAALGSIDLRTIDLSSTRPRAGIERHLREALGIAQLSDPIEAQLPPFPGRGIDGPDLGL